MTRPRTYWNKAQAQWLDLEDTGTKHNHNDSLEQSTITMTDVEHNGTKHIHDDLTYHNVISSQVTK